MKRIVKRSLFNKTAKTKGNVKRNSVRVYVAPFITTGAVPLGIDYPAQERHDLPRWAKWLTRFLLAVIAICSFLLLSGCDKKEDAPPPYYPHVAGSWSGQGDDNSIGFFYIGFNITQAGDSAAGTFTTSGGTGTGSGNVRIDFGPQGGNNLRVLTMTRTGGSLCPGSMTLVGSSYITGSHVSFRYTVTDCHGTNTGGASLHKDAGTN